MAFITRFQELNKLDFTKKYIFIERSISWFKMNFISFVKDLVLSVSKDSKRRVSNILLNKIAKT